MTGNKRRNFMCSVVQQENCALVWVAFLAEKCKAYPDNLLRSFNPSYLPAGGSLLPQQFRNWFTAPFPSVLCNWLLWCKYKFTHPEGLKTISQELVCIESLLRGVFLCDFLRLVTWLKWEQAWDPGPHAIRWVLRSPPWSSVFEIVHSLARPCIQGPMLSLSWCLGSV